MSFAIESAGAIAMPIGALIACIPAWITLRQGLAIHILGGLIAGAGYLAIILF